MQIPIGGRTMLGSSGSDRGNMCWITDAVEVVIQSFGCGASFATALSTARMSTKLSFDGSGGSSSSPLIATTLAVPSVNSPGGRTNPGPQPDPTAMLATTAMTPHAIRHHTPSPGLVH